MNTTTLNRLTLGVLILLPAILFATTFSAEYDVATFGGDVSTVFVPRIFLIVWFGLAIWAMIDNFRATSDGNENAEGESQPSLGRLLIIALITIITAVAMLYIGFVLAAIPGYFLFCWAFGYRKPIPLLIISIISVLTTWVIFNNVLELVLPHSPWFTLF